MKKFLFTPLVLLAAFCISCNDAGGPSAAAKKNLDAMHGISKAFETKDFSKIGDYIAEDAVDHAGEKGDVKGLANIKAEMEKMASTTENDKSEVRRELADDEYVMTWATYSGTMKTDAMGMKAGDKFSMDGVEVVKFKDGKAVEHWTFVNPGEMMKMMANMPPPGTMPTMVDSMTIDTVKKK